MTDSLIVVKGVIKDAEDGEPVIGADVYVRGTDPDKRVSGVNHTRTNLDGEFELRVAPGTVMETDCLGYLPSTCKAEPDMVIKLKLDPTIPDGLPYGPEYDWTPTQNKTDSLIVVKGVVKDAEDGTPIIGACVYVYGTNPTKGARDVNYSETNQNGEFSLRVAPGALLVTECFVYLPITCKAEPDMVIELKRDLDALEDAIKTLSMYDVRTLCH